MKKALKVLPNFTVLAEVNNEQYLTDLIGTLGMFCERETNLETVDTFKITAHSFWRGMNKALADHVLYDYPLIDFAEELRKHSESVPEIVLKEIANWQKRFGVVTLLGGDCLMVSNTETLKEMQSNTLISSCIYNTEGNLLFFRNIGLAEIQLLVEKDIGVPVKIHVSKKFTPAAEESAAA